MNKLQEIMQAQGTPTLKAIAGVFGLQAVRLYSVAKQPKEGEVYDAKAYNWDAIMRFIERRLEPDTELATLEDVIAKALELDEEYKLSDRRRGTSTSKKKIEVDGKSIDARKYSHFEMEADTLIALKKDPRVYKIVYQTESHTVMIPVKEDGTAASQDVKVISNGMLNMKAWGPAFNEEEVAKNFKVMAETEAAE